MALFKANDAPHVKIKAAGGIANLDDARDFIALGADLLQGYFLARPAAVPDPIAPEAAEIIRAI